MLFKEKIKSGKALLGPFLNFCHPGVIEIAGLAGFDFAIIDNEHGEIGLENAVNMVRAAKLAGISPVVRVYRNQPELICKALDIGAEAVQIPQVCTKAEAESAISAANFSPQGSRGCNRFVRAANYSAMGKEEFFGKSNERVAVIIQVEGQQGMDNLEEIMSVPGIDVLFIGPYDLSASLGIPGQIDHPKLVEAMQKVMATAKKFGVALGFFVDDIPTAKKWRDMGIQYLSFGSDTGLMMEAFSAKVKEFKS